MSTKFVNGDNLKQAIEYLENGTLLVANTNMAPAYDNTKAYSAGEVVSYQTLIYEWIADAPAGTSPTNTSYAREISLAELTANLQTKIESGAVVANQAKSSFAINPVSSESGTAQDAPFISQGTGTANNTASVDVPPVAQHLEKQGYTVVENQLVSTPSGTIVSGTTITAKAASVTKDHKYLLIQNLSRASAGALTDYQTFLRINNSTFLYEYNKYPYYIYTASYTDYLYIGYQTYSQYGTQVTYEWRVVDLTQYFNGNSNIPSDLLSNPSHWSWYYNGTGAYNTGTIRNAPGRYLVTTGRQLWDEEWELGDFTDNGAEYPDNNRIRAKNYVLVIPNRTYYRKSPDNLTVYFYDKDKVGIGKTDAGKNNTFSTPVNCQYIRFSVSTSYGTTYHNDITISLYYSPEEGGEGYDSYYPYEEPNTYDTGTEELLAFDTKDPDGTWHKNTKTKDLGTITYTASGSGGVFYASFTSFPIVKNTDKMIANGYVTSNVNTEWTIASLGDKTIHMFYVNGYHYLIVANSAFAGYTAEQAKTALSGTILNYLTDAPTTEQGTPFAPNIDDNDYGMMYWLDTDGNLVSTPQGCKIFYPFDYVLGLDTLFGYTSGDMTDLVRKSDIATQEEIDEILAILQ